VAVRDLRATYLVVELARHGDGALQALALRCIDARFPGALVKVGDPDPRHERELRNALTQMVLAGVTDGFRLAILAIEERTASRYRTTVRDLQAAGVDARLFDSDADAVHWLMHPAGEPG
jgi:hypothetical protein